MHCTFFCKKFRNRCIKVLWMRKKSDWMHKSFWMHSLWVHKMIVPLVPVVIRNSYVHEHVGGGKLL